MTAVREETWDTASNREAERGLGSGLSESLGDGDHDWLAIARSSYTGSTDWVNANLRNRWERNLRSFNNQHPTGSKYYSNDYKHRSKLFRPKSRAALRNAEAYAAQAFFATQDLLDVRAADEDDEQQAASAAINKELLNQRLEKKPIPWFLTLVGAYQDTRTLGICISKQSWNYEERDNGSTFEPAIDELGQPIYDAEGVPVMNEVPNIEIIKDEPQVRLIAPENIRIDPGAEWLDPINSSPYVIELIPMYVGDIRERMGKIDPKSGEPVWFELSDEQIHQAKTQEYNSTRQAREGYREDSKESKTQLRDHDIAWVHENVVRIDGQDWHWFTLGVYHLLSEAQPLETTYRQGERPWVLGFSNVEAHKTYPASVFELTEDLQKEANEIANQRIDNVRLAMNPRYFYKLGGSVDLTTLARSTPGGPVGMKHPGGTDPDVFIDRPPDVTQSAYAEQDRLNLDFDEMAGSFSASSVQSNRQMNETVGGMKLLSSSANTVQDYDLRTFAETWVEPVLGQLIRLEQAYETDEVLLAVAAKKSKVWQRFGVSETNDKMLEGQFTVRVNVGIGSTDPTIKLDRFLTGTTAIGELFGEEIRADIDKRAVVGEIFGILGYRDADRFFLWDDDDPKIGQLQKMVEELTKIIETQQIDAETKKAIEQIRASAGLKKQEMGDKSKILIELLKQEGVMDINQVSYEATTAGQAFTAAHAQRQAASERFGKAREGDAQRQSQAQESEAQRRAQAQESMAQRQFQGAESEAGRKFQGSESAAERTSRQQQNLGRTDA